MKRFGLTSFAFLISFILASCSSPFVTYLTTPSGGILFEEDFSDITRGWSQVIESHGIMNYDENGYRMWVNTPGYNYWSTAGLNFTDVLIEVDASRLSGPEENRFGLICRYQDAENYYFFIISSDGYFGIGKVINGETTLLGQEMMTHFPGIKPGEALNHLNASCVGEYLSLYINDQPVAMTKDTDLDSGDVGLLAGAFEKAGVDILFDNFIVYKP